MGLHEAIAAFPGELGGKQAVGDAYSFRDGAGDAISRIDRDVREMLRECNCDGSG
nr:hypothetical protein [Paenibacillus sp. MYb63]